VSLHPNHDGVLGPDGEATLRPAGVPLPYNFLSRSEWQGAFFKSRLQSRQTNEKLNIYLPPARWLFDRQLHFVSFLEPKAA